MKLRASVDVSQAVSGLNDLQKKQIPFALAATLTACARRGQEAVQGSLKGKFKLRNDFTRQGIRIKPAEKKSTLIEADVHTDTANRRTGAPDYLVAQDEGGEKIPHAGGTYLAVPTRYLRMLAPGVIPQELRPRNLLGAVGGRYMFVKRNKQAALRNQKLTEGMEFFLQSLKDGHKAIMGRYWTDREACPYYLLIPEATINPRLGMENTVRTAVERAFPGAWQETWRRIMAKGLKIS
jgi:hypothetical protein